MVSLFTREWIEIERNYSTSGIINVSLFTREWIEILIWTRRYWDVGVSLFTREWIEIATMKLHKYPLFASPSLRGSGLKFL